MLWHYSRPSEIRKSNMIIGVLTLMNIIIITLSDRASGLGIKIQDERVVIEQ